LKILRGYVKFIGIFSERVAKAFAWLTVILIIGMVYSTLMRYVFNKPPLWTYDSVYYCANVMFMMGAAYVLSIKGNVSIDLFYRKLSPRGRAIADITLSLIFFFPLFSGLFYFSMIEVPFSWGLGQKAVESVIRIPIYPLKTVIPVTCMMLLLQGVAGLICNVVFLATGRELQWK
jgi:TRAP-type mannitol/chloroaromatic compound transport system permease small subunit